ncbi:MAG TPA: cupin domain-containing protein [Pedobacter sp.]|uniref:cupin domain-containing protein n=1 Tax=Pedobacter sp. TaxID=1411316 RepID=UPI002CC228B2|nr:cupin domain-containing protein [Pedobacter sp.]HMI01437.1 cupin domain-containing protein [Pedobacter sp.]
MKIAERLINLNINNIDAIGTSHSSGLKKVISAGFKEAMTVKQIAEGMLMPGDVIPVHNHFDMDECYFFLEGHGYMYIDDDAIALRAGQVINVPAGAEHRLVCTSGPLRFFYLCLELTNNN